VVVGVAEIMGIFGVVFVCFLSLCRLSVLFVSVGASLLLFVCIVSNCMFVALWLCVRVMFFQGTRVEAVLGLPQPFGGSLLWSLVFLFVFSILLSFCFVVCFVVFVF